MRHHILFNSELGKWQLVFIVKYYFSKQQYYRFWINLHLAFTETMMNMLHFWGVCALNEKQDLVIHNIIKA